MKDYEYLEFLNKDYLEVVESKEYAIGSKIVMAKKLLKKGKVITLIKKLIDNLRIKRYTRPTVSKDVNNNIDYTKKKVAVYTCMIGDYDYVRRPKYLSSNCDYFIITDMKKNYNILNKITATKTVKEKLGNDNILVNRYYKMHPFEIFEGYDYAIYIDSNVEIMSDISKLIQGLDNDYGVAMHAHSKRDCIYNEGKVCRILKKGNKKNIKKQLKRYKKEGFPKHYGMLECAVIVTDLNNLNAKKIMEDWWKEFEGSEARRDQLSLPYVLWKNDVCVEDLTGLGKNIYRNRLYRINKKHK